MPHCADASRASSPHARGPPARQEAPPRTTTACRHTKGTPRRGRPRARAQRAQVRATGVEP
eukprot:5766885-Prymnesium_polylepis.1